MTLTLRSTKGTRLTHHELDENFAHFTDRSGISALNYMTAAEKADVQAGTLLVDVGPALQLAINAATAAKASGASVFLPAGMYRIATALVLPAGSGGCVVQGSGLYQGDPRTGIRTGPHTVLVWDGVVSGTMISGAGNLGWRFADMTLVGRATAAGANRAAIGYHCQYSASFGSGVGMFWNVSFIDFDTCVQMGTALGDGTCADMLYGRVTFEASDKGLVTKNSQSVNHKFSFLSATTVLQVVRMEGGGNLYVDVANFNGCGGTGGTVTDNWMLMLLGLGDNTGQCTFNNLRIENASKQLLWAEDSGSVVFNNFNEAQTDQGLTMVKNRGCRVRFNDSRIISKLVTDAFFSMAIGDGSQIPSTILDNCHLDVTTFVFDEWFEFTVTSQCFLKALDCVYKDGQTHLPDINSHIAHGPVHHFGQTTSGAAINYYLNGGTTAVPVAANTYNVCRIPDNSNCLIDAFVVGKEDGGGVDTATFHRRLSVSNKAGTVAIGDTQTVGVDYNSDAWGVPTFSVASLGIRTVATGKASTTINWKTTFVPVSITAEY